MDKRLFFKRNTHNLFFNFTGFFSSLFNLAFRITSPVPIDFIECFAIIYAVDYLFLSRIMKTFPFVTHMLYCATINNPCSCIVYKFRVASDSDHVIIYVIRFVLFRFRFTETTYVSIFTTVKIFNLFILVFILL